jgi:hypothetical protein
VRVGISVTDQHPPRSNLVSGLQEQLVMVCAARDRGWNALGGTPFSSARTGVRCHQGAKTRSGKWLTRVVP